MTPAEREALKIAAQKARDTIYGRDEKGWVIDRWFRTDATPEVILHLLDLISTLELTLSNATKVGVLQMERIDALKASGKWISVQDRMPDVSELPVLAYASGYPDIFAEHNGRKVVHSLARSYNWGSRITHWQPLPAPPPEPIPVPGHKEII